MAEMEQRTPEFARLQELETLLREVNGILAPANQLLAAGRDGETYPKIFIVGPPRSGTTLTMQSIARSKIYAYPTNFLSRFYGAPLVGAKLQRLLMDEKFSFRNELADLRGDLPLTSANGKTEGALSPNEFWYFWRRFLPYDELDYAPAADIRAHGDIAGLRSELNGLADTFEKPFAMKAMILNENIPLLNSLFERAIFIQLRRDAVFNVQSLLEARQRQMGSMERWYSFKVQPFHKLRMLDPLRSVVGQVLWNNHAIDVGLSSVPDSRKIVLQYEDFCKSPDLLFSALATRVNAMTAGDFAVLPDHQLRDLHDTNRWRLTDYSRSDVEAAISETDVTELEGHDA